MDEQIKKMWSAVEYYSAIKRMKSCHLQQHGWTSKALRNESLPSGMSQLVGTSPHTPKACRFNSRSGHTLRLRVWSLLWAHVGGNQSMVLSHINVSFSDQCLSVCSSPPRPAPLTHLSLKSINILGWGFLKSSRNKIQFGIQEAVLIEEISKTYG